MPLTTPITDDDLPATANGVHTPPPEPELAEDGLPPFSEDALASLRARAWLDAEYDAGRLDQYYGEYLYSLDHKIISHHVLLGPAWDEAEAYAQAHGIPFERLVLYNIPSIEYPMRIE